MQLNRKQEEGLKIAVSRYRQNEPWTCISGYAGTGKSTLVTHIIQALGLYPDEVAYATFTGKAAQVLQQKGCPNATTAHKLLYKFGKTKTGKFYQYPKIVGELNEFSLIIIDEVSMLPKEMWDLLLGHRIHVIALGDPGQLPPLFGSNGVLDNPHIFLDEIMRQAEDNEIIRISMDIREGKPLEKFSGQNVKIIDKEDLVPGMFLWADQIICAKNDTRQMINNYFRQEFKKFNSPFIQKCDKIICLRNEWKKFSNMGYNLINGTIGFVRQSELIEGHPMYGSQYVTFDTEIGDTFSNVCMNLNYDEQLDLKIRKCPHPIPFDFGYAITCWKSQGSQWNKILLYEENFPFDRQEKKKYLYTGITRAVDKAIIIRKGQ